MLPSVANCEWATVNPWMPTRLFPPFSLLEGGLSSSSLKSRLSAAELCQNVESFRQERVLQLYES